MELSRSKIELKDQRPQQCRRCLTRRPLFGIAFVSGQKPSIASRATEHCIASRYFFSSSCLDRLRDLLSSKSLFKASSPISCDKNSTNKSAAIARITVSDWAKHAITIGFKQILKYKINHGFVAMGHMCEKQLAFIRWLIYHQTQGAFCKRYCMSLAILR